MTVAEALAALHEAAEREFACDPDAVLTAIGEAISQFDADFKRLDDVCGRLYAVQARLQRAWDISDAASTRVANARNDAEQVAVDLEALCDRLKTNAETAP